MKFPEFEYVAPSSVEEAVGILASDSEARPLAGGQSLLPLLALRFSHPTALVDLEPLKDLGEVTKNSQVVSVGALVRQAACESSQVVRDSLPLLFEAIKHVGHPAIRNRGTVGGSLAHADPAAELPVVMTALDASIIAEGVSGSRRIAASDFFIDHFTTALEPGEILTRVDIPVSRGAWVFKEIARRHGDFALAMAAVGVEVENQECAKARIVLGGVGSAPVRAEAAESVLVGSRIDDAAAERAANEATGNLQPLSDVHASADYRKHVAGVLVRRAIVEAGRRAA